MILKPLTTGYGKHPHDQGRESLCNMPAVFSDGFDCVQALSSLHRCEASSTLSPPMMAATYNYHYYISTLRDFASYTNIEQYPHLQPFHLHCTYTPVAGSRSRLSISQTPTQGNTPRYAAETQFIR